MRLLFDDVRVVEVAQYVFGPAASGILSNLGADVIKVERAGRGDPHRGVGPPSHGVDVGIEMPNRGKRSISLDLSHPDGRQVLMKLVGGADVFLTNYLPSPRRKLGIDVDDVRAANPGAIYALATGVGSAGPDADLPGYDASSYWARGGIAFTLSDGATVPVQPGAFGDKTAAMNLAFGIAAALFDRQRTGKGCVVETSLLATALWQNSSTVAYSLGAGRDLRRQDGPITNPLVNTYRTADGRWIALVMQDIGRFWKELCIALDREDLLADERFAGPEAIVANADACADELQRTFAGGPLRTWTERLSGASGSWSPVQTVLEAAADVQSQANDYVEEIVAPDGGVVRMVRYPLKVDGQPLATVRGPACGEHTVEILRELGYDGDTIARLEAEGVTTASTADRPKVVGQHR